MAVREHGADDEIRVELLRDERHRVTVAGAFPLCAQLGARFLERLLDLCGRQLLDGVQRAIERHMQREVEPILDELACLLRRVRTLDDERHAREPQRRARLGRLRQKQQTGAEKEHGTAYFLKNLHNKNLLRRAAKACRTMPAAAASAQAARRSRSKSAPQPTR